MRFTVVIPAYRPPEELRNLVLELLDAGRFEVIVVNDGSGKEFDALFDSLTEICRVVQHSENSGKGQALKTGFAAASGHGQCDWVITADADGQHTISDISALADRILQLDSPLKTGNNEIQNKKKGGGESSSLNRNFILGSRTFVKSETPWKSYLGNRLTSSVFYFLFGVKIRDTQTGLRAFHKSQVTFWNEITKSGYQFEMAQLVRVATDQYQVIEVSIPATYLDMKNSVSHFRPIFDSIKIYRVMLSEFFLFVASSLSSFLVDMGIYIALLIIFFEGEATTVQTGLSVLLARAVSIAYNYTFNKKIVFKASRTRNSFTKYLGLATLVGSLTALSTMLIHHFLGGHAVVAKIASDALLFFLSYAFQKRFVFKSQMRSNESD